MQFFAALVEHLVVGIVALLWLLPLAHFFAMIPILPPTEKWSDYKEVLVAVGLPAAYVAGMYIDVCASILTRRLKLTKAAETLFGAGAGGSYAGTITILRNSPDESARYLLQLSARDKIARGVALNFLLGAAVNLVLPNSAFSVPAWILLVLCAAGVLVWMRLYVLVKRFKSQWKKQ